MFNILPGQGLGFSGSKQIALGLGYAVTAITPVVYRKIEGGEAGPSDWADDHRLLVIKDDEEVIGIITNIITSGIL